ncbi:MAG: S41 family peptidase [Acidobacteriota bacterium]
MPEKIVKLSDFLDSVRGKQRLKKKDRLRIVEQALLLLEMNYVHLPLKRAMHAIDPNQQLKLLRFRISEMKESELSPEIQFHRRMLEIFASTRDLHTMYLLPNPYRDHVAYLPFLIEQYFEKRGRGKQVEKFLVSRVATADYHTVRDNDLDHEAFECGVEPLYWNGVPIRRAIEVNGNMQSGSNLDARFARGLDNFTTRPLDTSLPPDEMWVDLTYRSKSGKVLTHRQDWLVMTSETETSGYAATASIEHRAAIDIKRTRINEINRTLYTQREQPQRKTIKNSLYAEPRRVYGKDFGYVRLFSFDVADPEKFIKKFAAIITADDFPQEGLIIDVRGNGGGRIRAGERLLQLLTPRRIEPELFEFINTPLNLDICRRAPKSWNLKRWVSSIAESVATGATYSSGFALNSVDSCNDIGQVYFGPVVLITDALSYSTTDIFAAGFQDNEIGEILGTSNNTGAGGANVWWYDDLRRALGDGRSSPFKVLPKGADMLVAMRRSIRIGPKAGRPLEELGITPNQRHYLTERDILGRNDDLIARAAGILRKRPSYKLSVKVTGTRASSTMSLSAASHVSARDKRSRISRVDVYVDGQPERSIEAKDGSIGSRRIALSGKKGAELRVEAFDGSNRLVATSRKLL